MNEEAMKQRREINYVPTQRNDLGHVPKTNLENDNAHIDCTQGAKD